MGKQMNDWVNKLVVYGVSCIICNVILAFIRVAGGQYRFSSWDLNGFCS